MRNRLSYANVVATLALVIAVGTGGAWAATQISGKLLQDRSTPGKKLKKNTVTGKEVKESKLTKVPKAKASDLAVNASRLGGTLASGFLKGGGTHTAGRTTGSGGADDNAVKTFDTSVGRFQLICGGANARLTYVNIADGYADGYQGYEFGGDTGHDVTYLLIPRGGDLHFDATAETGPTMAEQRISKGNSIAIMRVGEVRNGASCLWNWDLFTSG